MRSGKRLALLLALPLVIASGPSASLEDLDGKTVTVPIGSPEHDIVLHFWATWCPPCKLELQILSRLAASSCTSDFEVLVVNVGEDVKKVRHFVRENELDLDVLIDPRGDVFRSLTGGGLPATHVSRRGQVQQLDGSLTEDQWSELLGVRSCQ